MKINPKTKPLVIATTLAFLVQGIFLAAAAPALAGRDSKRSAARSPEAYRPGRAVKSLPPNHRVVRVDRQDYFYHHGAFYRPEPRRGYVVVRPPRNAVVMSLPIGFATAVIAGITYCIFAGTYYRPVAAGYQVVDPPPVNGPSAGDGSRVSVSVELLNVRSGPGSDHPVTAQVSRGAILVVRGTAPGWFYVGLANGDSGWVMTSYTTPITPPASG